MVFHGFDELAEDLYLFSVEGGNLGVGIESMCTGDGDEGSDLQEFHKKGSD